MSTNTGTLVSAAIRPIDSLDTIATAYASEIKGGHHSVATIADRNAIITQRKEVGMLCSVYNDGVNNGTYQLVALPNSWVIFNSSSSNQSTSTWLNTAKDRLTAPPLVVSVGDRILIGTSASGLFTGHDNKVAQYTASGWSYSIPVNGNHIALQSEDNGVWRYINTYPTGKWIKYLTGGISIKNYVENETIEVPENYQYLVYGDLTIANGGGIINYGQVVTLNGNLIITGSGTFSNYGTYISPSISTKKYAATINLVADTSLTVTHNLYTTDIICSIYESNSPIEFDMTIISNTEVSITVNSTITARINIIS